MTDRAGSPGGTVAGKRPDSTRRAGTGGKEPRPSRLHMRLVPELLHSSNQSWQQIREMRLGCSLYPSENGVTREGGGDERGLINIHPLCSIICPLSQGYKIMGNRNNLLSLHMCRPSDSRFTALAVQGPVLSHIKYVHTA